MEASNLPTHAVGILKGVTDTQVLQKAFIIREFYQQLMQFRHKLIDHIHKNRVYVLTGDYGMAVNLRDRMFKPVTRVEFTTENIGKAKEIIEGVFDLAPVDTRYAYDNNKVYNSDEELAFDLMAEADSPRDILFEEIIPVHITRGHIYKPNLVDIPTNYYGEKKFKGFVAPLEGIIASKLYNVCIGIEDYAEDAKKLNAKALNDLYDLYHLLALDYDEEAMLINLNSVMHHYERNIYEVLDNIFDKTFMDIHGVSYKSTLKENLIPFIPLEEITEKASQKIKQSLIKGTKKIV